MENLADRALTVLGRHQLVPVGWPRSRGDTAGRPAGRLPHRRNDHVPRVTERCASQVDAYIDLDSTTEVEVEITISSKDSTQNLEHLLIDLTTAVAAMMHRQGWE